MPKIRPTKTTSSLNGAYGRVWQASTAYSTGDIVRAPDGSIIQRIAGATSRPAYDATEAALWTTLVATKTASDTAYAAKSLLPYIASAPSGGDDLATLTSEVAAATTAGREYRLREGTYKLSAPLAPPTDAKIVGAGRRKTFLSLTSGAGTSTGLITVYSANNVEIRDIGFLGGTKVGQAVEFRTALGGLVERCWFDAGNGWPVMIAVNSRRVKILNCIMEGTRTSNGVEVNNSSYCEVIGCHIKGSASNGIEDYMNEAGENVGNRYIDNIIESTTSSGIGLFGSVNALVKGNTLRNTSVTGILLVAAEILGPTYPAQGCTIADNVVVGANAGNVGAHGINAFGVGHTISGNVVRGTQGTGSGGAGISATGTFFVIANNTCRLNSTQGIALVGNTSTRCSIIGNTCTDNSVVGSAGRDNIYVEGAFTTIMGNTCGDTRTTKLVRYSMFLAAGADDCVLIGNMLQTGVTGTLATNQALRAQVFGNEGALLSRPFITSGSPGSSTPSVVKGTAVDTGTAAVATGSNDVSGQININPAGTPVAGKLFTVTFGKAQAYANVFLQATGPNAAAAQLYRVSTSTGFEVWCKNAPATGLEGIAYWVLA